MNLRTFSEASIVALSLLFSNLTAFAVPEAVRAARKVAGDNDVQMQITCTQRGAEKNRFRFVQYQDERLQLYVNDSLWPADPLLSEDDGTIVIMNMTSPVGYMFVDFTLKKAKVSAIADISWRANTGAGPLRIRPTAKFNCKTGY